jgi:hypothetical protein
LVAFDDHGYPEEVLLVTRGAQERSEAAGPASTLGFTFETRQNAGVDVTAMTTGCHRGDTNKEHDRNKRHDRPGLRYRNVVNSGCGIVQNVCRRQSSLAQSASLQIVRLKAEGTAIQDFVANDRPLFRFSAHALLQRHCAANGSPGRSR